MKIKYKAFIELQIMNNKPDGEHWGQMCAELQFIKFLRQTVDIFEEIIGSLKKKKGFQMCNSFRAFRVTGAQ